MTEVIPVSVTKTEDSLIDYLHLLDSFTRKGNFNLGSINANCLKHVHFGFRIRSDSLAMFAMQEDNLKFLFAPNGECIVTGSLLQWYETLTSDIIPIEIMNPIFNYFEQAGLRDIWSRYRKRVVGEGFILVKQ